MNKKKQIIKSTDWLIMGYSEEEITKIKAEAIREATEEIRNKEIEEMYKDLDEIYSVDFKGDYESGIKDIATALYDMGYRRQSEEDLIDKIATYFEEDGNWTRLKHDAWLMNGRSDELRRMLRESLNQ